MRILAFGEIIWDVYSDKCCIGGAPLNFAAHAAKSGSDVFLLSAVGKDELGKNALKEIERFHIGVNYVDVNPTKVSGQCIVTLDPNAVPVYRILNDVAYDYIPLFPEILLSEFNALAFGTLALRSTQNLSTLKKLISEGTFEKLYCDLNLREPFYNEATVSFCLEHANIIKLSETELDIIQHRMVKNKTDSYENRMYILAEAYRNLEVILLTCGENGAYAYICREKNVYYTPASKVKVVSTVGAGDSFGAVFLVNYLSGKKIPECMEMATERSAYVVSHVEAVPG